MKPKSKKQHFGVEIEFFARKSHELAAYLLTEKLKSAVDWNLGNDASIDPPDTLCKACDLFTFDEDEVPCTCYETFELRVLMEEANIDKVMDELGEAFKKINPKVNSSCGLHVHVDSRNKDKKLLFNNLVACQDLFFKMQPTARRSNTYCRRNNHTTFDESLSNDGRHSAVNPQAFEEHQSIEVRLHQGCVNTNKIKSWIKILAKVAKKSTMIKEPIERLKKFKEVIKLNKSDMIYMKKTLKLYSKAS